ncbi:hypothetical protein FACS1894109_09850 [Spirochaetia bacterium]|nr:hypothetical protein FACS1894109_09850 [Spirochaetia bacterium]
MKSFKTMTKEEKKLQELRAGMERLSDGGREQIRNISRVLFSLQGSIALPIPPEKAEGDGTRKRLPGTGR